MMWIYRVDAMLWLKLRFIRRFSIDVIPRNTIVPSSVLEWYQKELDLDWTQVRGKLLDLKLVQTRLEFYKQLGFSPYEFGELMSNRPEVLDLDHGITARQNLHFLLDLGVSSFTVVSVLSQYPEILTLSLEAHIKPRISYYIETLQLDLDGLRKLFEQCPEFLQFSILKDIRLRILYLIKMGLSLEEVTTNVILPCPQVLGRDFNSSLKSKIEFLRIQLGRNPVSVVLKEFPNFMHLSVETQLKPFVDYFLEELNMGRRLLCQMLKTNPHILSAHLDREIKPKIVFLQGLGLDQLEVFKVIVHSPSVFKKSLQEGMCKKIEEFKDMGVPLNTINTLLVKCPKYFTSYQSHYTNLKEWRFAAKNTNKATAQRTFAFFARWIPGQRRICNESGGPSRVQISHLCHRRNCIRIDHMIVEEQWRSCKRNSCGSNDGCDCGNEIKCLRGYDMEEPSDDPVFCQTRSEATKALTGAPQFLIHEANRFTNMDRKARKAD